MDTHFERNKNLKAFGLTAVICTLLLLMLFFISWNIPKITPPPVDEGIEVNLGNSDEGLGDVPPQIPGSPAETAEPLADNPPASTETNTSSADPVTPADDADATPVATADKKTDTKTTTATPKKTNNNTNNTIVTPPAPKPKAVYGGGSKEGSGGNNADSYNGVRNQGIAGGNGDQGKPNGNPNSDSYTGNGGTGKSGVSIRSGLGGRKFTKLPAFEDDFNTPAKVAVDIKVDQNGNVISAIVNPRGTTTTNAGIRSIALRKARELKLNAADEEQSGTIVFDFKIRG